LGSESLFYKMWLNAFPLYIYVPLSTKAYSRISPFYIVPPKGIKDLVATTSFHGPLSSRRKVCGIVPGHRLSWWCLLFFAFVACHRPNEPMRVASEPSMTRRRLRMRLPSAAPRRAFGNLVCCLRSGPLPKVFLLPLVSPFGRAFGARISRFKL
jgi:hypothetical protein